MVQATFIGLGVMGYPMAGHLVKAGHQVTVFNRTLAKAEKWMKEYGGRIAPTPALAVQDADFVFCCVGNDDDVRSMTTAKDGAFEGMKKDAIFVDHTTTSANLAREIYTAALARGLHFLDAPVSGGQSGAENGQLTIMVGGDEEIFAKAEPVMKAYAKAIQYMGTNGNGQLTKMVNQVCIAGVVQGLAEAMSLAKAGGLDLAKVHAAIGKGAAQSWQMDNRWATMSEGKFDFGFAVDWMRKDLGFCIEEAKKRGVNLPLTQMVDGFYGELQKAGGNRLDTSSLVLRLGQIKQAK